MKTEFQLLPHEIIFGAFLLVTWFRLVFAVGFFAPHTLFYLVLVGISGGLIYACRRQETSLRWRARLLFYFVAMNAVYAHLKVAVPAMHPGTADALLQKMDRWLIGRNLSLRMETLVHPALTEFFSACYILFFPYLLLSVIVYCVGDLETFKKFTTGLFSIYGLGFLGYTLLPAQGPHLVMTDQFSVPLTGGWITHWNAEIVRLGSNHVDVFPSLHCAVSSFFLFFDRVHKPWRFKLYLVPCVGLWISTIYLRYHYCVDLTAGFALSAVSLWLVKNCKSKGVSHEIPAQV